jgi:hypothetical protein
MAHQEVEDHSNYRLALEQRLQKVLPILSSTGATNQPHDLDHADRALLSLLAAVVESSKEATKTSSPEADNHTVSDTSCLYTVNGRDPQLLFRQQEVSMLKDPQLNRLHSTLQKILGSK